MQPDVTLRYETLILLIGRLGATTTVSEAARCLADNLKYVVHLTSLRCVRRGPAGLLAIELSAGRSVVETFRWDELAPFELQMFVKRRPRLLSREDVEAEGEALPSSVRGARAVFSCVGPSRDSESAWVFTFSTEAPRIHPHDRKFGLLLTGLVSEKIEKIMAIEQLRAARDQLLEEVQRHDKTQQALRRSQRLEALGQLTSAIGHEINNPIAYALLNLELLSDRLGDAAVLPDDEVRDSVTESLDEALFGVRHVTEIVRDMKHASHMGEGDLESLVIQDVLARSLRLAMPRIRERARLEEHYEIGATVWANRSRLSRVFLNLLVNACQAIPVGDASAHRIEIRTMTRDGAVVVEISDDGAGIESDVLPRIFDAFLTTKVAGEGTGLGLSMCRDAIESLGGAIEVESTLGEGSTFRVVLPSAARVSDEPAVRLSRARRRLLVLDTDRRFLQRVRHELSERYLLTVLGDTAEALERIDGQEHYDLILCELSFAQADDGRLWQALSAPELLERVVIVTAGAFTESTVQFLDSVPNRRLFKPVESRSIIELLSDER